MYHKIFRIPVLNFIFRTARTIPIAPARENPELLQKAFVEIERALRDGELVGIFPEGGLTPDGAIQTFKPGIEKMLETTPVPVIPMAVRGLWLSMWSRRDSTLGRSRLPRRIRARIELIAAPPMDGTTLKAADLEAEVRALRGDRP
ncbi:MAG: transporter, partial [Panacagrimonas sp.]